MEPRDKAQQGTRRLPRASRLIAAWLRRVAGHGGARQTPGTTEPTPALDLLPRLLDGSSLPNGVVEVVIDDPRLSMRRLFDVHDGEILVVQPGSAVPWTSIRGSSNAWAAALGCGGDVSQLHHTGEPDLAEKVLSALEKKRLCPSRDERRYSVLDCS
ncbi:MAG: hypothetical protein ACTHM1_05430 [Solirubrobacteraceae bacterium]